LQGQALRRIAVRRRAEALDEHRLQA
jgi:hypothetical protein